MASHQIMDAQPDAKCDPSAAMDGETEQRVLILMPKSEYISRVKCQ